MKPIKIELQISTDDGRLCVSGAVSQGRKRQGVATQAKRPGMRALMIQLADALELALEDFEVTK